SGPLAGVSSIVTVSGKFPEVVVNALFLSGLADRPTLVRDVGILNPDDLKNARTWLSCEILSRPPKDTPFHGLRGLRQRWRGFLSYTTVRLLTWRHDSLMPMAGITLNCFSDHRLWDSRRVVEVHYASSLGADMSVSSVELFIGQW
ncbi:hypothetical protein BDZ89DRAFT_1046021, partial [Hymenopellis radicata]